MAVNCLMTVQSWGGDNVLFFRCVLRKQFCVKQIIWFSRFCMLVYIEANFFRQSGHSINILQVELSLHGATSSISV